MKQHIDSDRLAWWEEVPLGLALVAQSYVVGLWYYSSISGAAWFVDLLVAIGAGLALDLIVVTTVMGRRAGRSSGWSWATSLGAFVCSSLVALDRYGWQAHNLLHVCFPLVVFLYSQHLAVARKRPVADQKTALETLPERSKSSEADALDTLADLLELSAPVAPAQNDRLILSAALNGASGGALEPSEALEATVAVAQYTCPHCSAPLKSKQARGAAVANGHCPACR